MRKLQRTLQLLSPIAPMEDKKSWPSLETFKNFPSLIYYN